MLIREVMTESVVTASPHCTVREVAEIMRERNVGSVVLVEDDRLIGIVTLDDLASRTGDPELAHELSSRVTRAVMPDFFFHERGDA